MNKRALIYFILASMLIGAFVVSIKAGMNAGLEPVPYALSSIMVSGFLAFLFLIPRMGKLKKIKKREWLYLALIGLTAAGIALILQFIGQSYTTAINAGFLLTLTGISTPLFSYFMVNERIPRIKWLFALIILLGVYLLTTNGKIITPNPGDFLIIAAVLVLGFSNTLSKMAMKDTTAEVVSSFRLLIGAIFLTITIPFFVKGAFLPFSSGLGYVLLSGFFTFAAVVFFLKGMELSSPGMAAISLMLQPVFATGFAFLFLKETLSAIQILGAFIVIIGFYLFTGHKQKFYKTNKKPE